MEHAPPADVFDTAHAARRRRKRWLIEAGLIFAFWTVLAVLLTSSRVLDARRGAPDIEVVLYQFLEMYLWALLTPGIFWLCRRFSIEQASWRTRVPLHLALAVPVSLAVDLMDDLNLRYVAQPSWADNINMSPLDALLELDFLDDLLIYLAVLAAGFARSYFLRLRERQTRESHLEARADRLQRQLTEARLQALRMQLNPHFLFNTLHAVSTLVGEDPAGVRRMIARLSELMRHVLEEAGRDEVPLREEMQFLRAYLDIMQIRFQGRLDVHLHATPGTEEALVPNLILQPLVENAVKHGAGEVEGTGRVAVRARRTGNRLLISVRDNGPRFAEGETPALDPGTGLANVRARLQELHGTDAALTFRAAEGGGLVAEVLLPYHTATDLHTQSRLEPAAA